ncbi:hypothetical protein P3382_26960, partial [Vibrio parahaemolyticus]|nr:hypothetical protein [Vibrio parahaemolyticus]
MLISAVMLGTLTCGSMGFWSQPLVAIKGTAVFGISMLVSFSASEVVTWLKRTPAGKECYNFIYFQESC